MKFGQSWSGEATRMAYDELWVYDPENIMPSKEFIKQMDETRIFREKLLFHMVECGYSNDLFDEKSQLDFLRKCCDKAKTHIEYNTLKNWIYTGKVSHSKEARKNYYMLCFALNMNAKQTAEFFAKAILDRPFLFKDLFETVCYFCLKNNLPYSEVERIVSMIEQIPPKKTEKNINSTMVIADSVMACDTEENLVRYWVNNCAGFGFFRHTAFSEVTVLINECYKLASECSSMKIKTPDKLLGEIYGYNARKIYGGKSKFKFNIKGSDYPEAVTRNFIQRQQIQNIEKQKASDEVLRKALILFSFYAFFADRWLRAENNGEVFCDSFDDFIDLMNKRLDKCGYSELYYRNPYDWMFAFCAQDDSPLETFPELIEELFVSNTD